MRERLILIVTCLLTAGFVNAQFKKGDKMVGASLASLFYDNSATDYSNTLGSSTTSTDRFGVHFAPAVGWFVSSDLVVGFTPVISFSKQKQLGKSASGSTYLKDDSHDFGIQFGGFSRYYFPGKATNTRLFGQYNLSMGIGTNATKGFEYETLGLYVDRYDRSSSGDFLVNTGAQLGVSRFIGTHAAIDFFLGYQFSFSRSNPSGTSVRDYADPATSDITTNIDYQQKVTAHHLLLGVAFQWFLPKK
mgnify:CR=1 FL=1